MYTYAYVCVCMSNIANSILKSAVAALSLMHFQPHNHFPSVPRHMVKNRSR